MDAKDQDERPVAAETVTKGLSNVALIEPHATSAPVVSKAESADVTTPNLHLEDTRAPPQAAASSDHEVAENTKQDSLLDVTPPQSSAVVVAHAAPSSEPPLSDGVEHPRAEETPGEVATPLAPNPEELPSEATPGAEEIPMNETGA